MRSWLTVYMIESLLITTPDDKQEGDAASARVIAGFGGLVDWWLKLCTTAQTGTGLSLNCVTNFLSVLCGAAINKLSIK